MPPRKVLLIVIDAATPRVVCPAIRTGRLPVLQRLAEAGRMHESSVSIFPSITPAASSTIATGCYPAEHGIAGAYARHSDARRGRRAAPAAWAARLTSAGYGVAPCSRIHALICASRRSTGSGPFQSTASWKARRSNRVPSAASARARSSRSFSSPIL